MNCLSEEKEMEKSFISTLDIEKRLKEAGGKVLDLLREMDMDSIEAIILFDQLTEFLKKHLEKEGVGIFDLSKKDELVNYAEFVASHN